MTTGLRECECGCGCGRVSPRNRYINGHRQDALAVAYWTGVIDRLTSSARRTTRTDLIGQAYDRGYQAATP